jgi:hypothetical protein
MTEVQAQLDGFENGAFPAFVVANYYVYVVVELEQLICKFLEVCDSQLFYPCHSIVPWICPRRYESTSCAPARVLASPSLSNRMLRRPPA